MNKAIISFRLSLNRVRLLWVRWYSYYNDIESPPHWETIPDRIAERRTYHRDVISVHLLCALLQVLRDDMEYDYIHWSNRGGCLGMYRIEVVGDGVWAVCRNGPLKRTL